MTEASWFGTVALLARKEFGDTVRSRWLLYGTVVFAVLSVAVFFGTAAIGGSLQYQPLSTVLNSMVSLTVFMLPLLAILVSYDAFVGELESGTMLLMLTYPISRLQWLLGKALGQGIALLLVLLLGNAVLPILSVALGLNWSWTELAGKLSFLVGSSWLLGLVFMLVGFVMSLTARQKARALAMLLVIWLVAVLLYDLALLVVAVAGADFFGRTTLSMMMAVNPASIYRLINQDMLGVLTVEAAPICVLLGVILSWIATLFGTAAWLFHRRRF